MAEKISRAEYLGRQLKRKMEEHGFTSPYQLSLKTGVKEPVIYRYMRGQARQPDAFTLVKLAVGLGVSVDWLIGTNEPDVEIPPTGAGALASV